LNSQGYLGGVLLGTESSIEGSTLHKNQPTTSGFSFPEIIPLPFEFPENFCTVRKVDAADLDSDGDLDILAANACFTNFQWWENSDGLGTFIGPNDVLTSGTGSTEEVYPADLDGDNDIDVLIGKTFANHLAWYENLDGMGNFSMDRKLETTEVILPAQVIAADIDTDGDLDVVMGSLLAIDDVILWFENLDGKGNFSTEILIASSLDWVSDLEAADLDGDGDVDLVASLRRDNKFVWFKNLDGEGTFSTQQVLSDSSLAPQGIVPIDYDGDGDLDIVGATDTGELHLFQNLDSMGTFGNAVIFQTVISFSDFNTADIDGDGDPDLLGANSSFNQVAIFENLDGRGTFSGAIFIPINGDESMNDPLTVAAADLDGDGDHDIIAGAGFMVDDYVSWYPNRGEQFELTTVNTSTGAIMEGVADDVLAISLVDRNLTGSLTLELEQLSFTFLGPNDNPLTTTEANNLIEGFSIYRDAGNEQYDTVTDQHVLTLNNLTLDTSGTLVLTFADDDPNVQVRSDTSAVFFVVIQPTTGAALQTPNAFRLIHLASDAKLKNAFTSMPVPIEQAKLIVGGDISIILVQNGLLIK
jgi:hypothetical protein